MFSFSNSSRNSNLKSLQKWNFQGVGRGAGFSQGVILICILMNRHSKCLSKRIFQISKQNFVLCFVAMNRNYVLGGTAEKNPVVSLLQSIESELQREPEYYEKISNSKKVFSMALYFFFIGQINSKQRKSLGFN